MRHFFVQNGNDVGDHIMIESRVATALDYQPQIVHKPVLFDKMFDFESLYLSEPALEQMEIAKFCLSLKRLFEGVPKGVLHVAMDFLGLEVWNEPFENLPTASIVGS